MSKFCDARLRDGAINAVAIAQLEQKAMKLVYGISRWTNPSRAAARHIDNGQHKPLCGGRGRKVFSWQEEDGEPTCASCIRIMNKQKQLSVVAPVMCSADDDGLEDEDNFQPCEQCDGHDACRDFGCAFKLGLGHMVQQPL